jgi:flagellar protein FlgJ
MDNLNSISNSYAYTDQTQSNDEISSLKSKADKLSAQSSDTDLEKAAKSFESYFVEQLLKQVADTTKKFGGEDESSSNSNVSMTKDMYMDSMYKDMAEQIVDKYGENFTSDMVAQMKRNYGVNITSAETDGTDTN